MGKFLHDFFASFWWGVRTLWWLLWWSPEVRVISLLLWLVSLSVVLAVGSPGRVFLFKVASGITAILWVIPLPWGAFRLYRRVRHTRTAAWIRADAEIARELNSQWIQQVRDLGFNLAGYLTKNCDEAPRLALFVNPENRDSAQISRMPWKDLLVFEARFADGFAFETCNAASAPSPVIANNLVFAFPETGLPFDLYRVHQRIKEDMGSGREPVILDGEGEIDEFISRSAEVRSHLMSRDYRLKADGYRFTMVGAIRKASLLLWPVKQLREAIFRRGALIQLTRLGFRLDRRTRRIVGQ